MSVEKALDWSRLRRLQRGVGRRASRLGEAVLGRLPAGLARPLRDVGQKARLRMGWGHVVPAKPCEDFLADQLEALRPVCNGSLQGNYLEFGVYVGTSMGAAVRAFDRAGVARARFFGFDSFSGLPAGSEAEGWTTGSFIASRAVAEWNLARQGVLHRVSLVEGWFDATCTPATVERLELGPALVAMIDCDTYSSSRVALDFVEPLLGEHGLLVFDDWYAWNTDGTAMEGQRRALHELLDRRPGLTVVEAGRPSLFGQAFRVSRSPAAVALPPTA